MPKSIIINGTGPYVDATLLIVIEAGVIVARPKAARFVTSVALAERSPLSIAVDQPQTHTVTNESWSYTIRKTGDFANICTFHPTMKAMLRVK